MYVFVISVREFLWACFFSDSSRNLSICKALGREKLVKNLRTAFRSVSDGSVFVGSSNHGISSALQVAINRDLGRSRNGRQIVIPPFSRTSCCPGRRLEG